jgi:hypothetical protein
VLERERGGDSNSEDVGCRERFFVICLFIATRAIFSYLVAVTIAGDRAANLGLRAFEQGRIFIVPHLLRHGTSVYTVSSERPAHTSHSGIRTPDARIIRALTTAPRWWLCRERSSWISRFLQIEGYGKCVPNIYVEQYNQRRSCRLID